MTAYFGLLHVGQPKPGETVVVEMNTESPATVTSWNLAQ